MSNLIAVNMEVLAEDVFVDDFIIWETRVVRITGKCQTSFDQDYEFTWEAFTPGGMMESSGFTVPNVSEITVVKIGERKF